jgi:predicted transglutaminase-like cysteine proteinase
MPNVNFLEVAAGMREMGSLETVYYYVINRQFRTSVSVTDWLRGWSDKDNALPLFEGPADDAKARKCLAWVKQNVVYTSDKVVWKMDEYWQTPEETLKLKTGDCEDGAILLYVLMKKNGFTDDQIFITCGAVVGGGHCYVVYVSNKDAVHYVLDWCYWPTDSLRVKYGDNSNYFFGEKEWFRFNSTSAYVRR